jgi:hypothetical protein
VEVGGFDGADPVVTALEGCSWAAGCAAAACGCGGGGSGASGGGGCWDSRVRAGEALRIVFSRLVGVLLDGRKSLHSLLERQFVIWRGMGSFAYLDTVHT